MAPASVPPKFLYLHGFASGPESSKGVAMAKHFAELGVELHRLNLRLPSFENLRLSAMMRATREAIGGGRDRAVIFGSSLGGLTAARVAEEDPRVCALVLLAPAFRMAERWERRLGPTEWAQWRDTGWMATEDYAENRASRVDFEFIREAGEIDARSDGWPDVRVPTLVIQGTSDDLVDPELARAWSKEKRHVRLIEVDDGHELRRSIPLIAAESQRFLSGFLNR